MYNQLSTLYYRYIKYPQEHSRFFRRVGYELDLAFPRAFNHKVVWKKLFDRNPLLPVVADKVRVREYVKQVLGKDCSHYLVPLLSVCDDPRALSPENLPDRFVIKANHGSNMHLLVDGMGNHSWCDIMRLCEGWLSTPYGARKHEWAYQEIPRKILVEELLESTGGAPLREIKFYVINGEVSIALSIQSDRGGTRYMNVYDRDWKHLEVRYRSFPKAGVSGRPDRLGSMVEVAEILAQPFDFVRVDMYLMDDGSFRIGELTNYPAAGYGRFYPMDFDFDLGAAWVLPLR